MEDRAVKILALIVESYIKDAKPVGSRNMSRDPRLRVSSATIRNAMVDLTELGFISKAYASAGRVPTDRGFRFYLNSICEYQQLSDRLLQQIETLFEDFSSKNLEDGLENLVFRLAKLTRLTALATTPQMNGARFRNINFLSLPENRVMITLVINGNMVYSRTVEFQQKSVSQTTLDSIAKHLNLNCVGMTLHEIRENIIELLNSHRGANPDLLPLTVRMTLKGLELAKQQNILCGGKWNILNWGDDYGQCAQLLRMMEEKTNLLDLLTYDDNDDEARILIGSEIPLDGLSGFSIVTSPYRCGDQATGCLGVLGPTHMDYTQLVPIIQQATYNLTNVLHI